MQREDAEAAGFAAGPFPVAEVPRPPSLMLRLLYDHGIRLTEAQIADYERIRAYLGYEGVKIAPALSLQTDLQTPSQETIPLPRGRARRREAPAPAVAAGIDARDLGDE